MKRMHVHVAVDDLQHSIGFYSALFAAQPAVVKPDYAKWMLDDPRVNFAISTRGRAARPRSPRHPGREQDELHEVYARLRKAGGNGDRAGPDRPAATPSRKSRGSTIRQALPGRLSYTTGEKHRLRRRQPASATARLAHAQSPVARRQVDRQRRPLLRPAAA